MIRVADKSDYTDMDSVFRSSVEALCVRDYDSEVLLDWIGEAKPERFELSANDGCTQYVKILKGVIACFGELNIEKQLLLSLFDSPNYAGKGIGQEMIEFLFTKASAAGIKVLKVDSSLNAANFYLRNGFVELSKCDFTTQNGVVLESIKMECALST